MAASRGGGPSPRLLAMHWLARREHSEHEIRSKLADREVEPAKIDAAVEGLLADGLISDERFTESFVQSRVRQGKGPQRIRAELGQKRVAGELVEQVLDGAGIDWFATAAEVRRKKFGAGEPADFKEKARQMRFLQYRGFSSEQIQFALDDNDVDAWAD